MRSIVSWSPSPQKQRMAHIELLHALSYAERRPPRRLEIGARQHLRDETEENELYAEQKEKDGKQGKRRIDEIRARDLERYRRERGKRAQRDTNNTKPPEKIHH